MRLMVGAHSFGINLSDLGGQLLIVSRKMRPETMVEKLATAGEINLVIIDTLATFFDGDDLNNNVEGGDFMRRLVFGKGGPTNCKADHERASAQAVALAERMFVVNEVSGSDVEAWCSVFAMKKA